MMLAWFERSGRRISAVTTVFLMRLMHLVWIDSSNQERYPLLFLLESARQRTRWHPDSYYQHLAWLTQQLSVCLREPEKRVREILHSHGTQRSLLMQRRAKYRQQAEIKHYRNAYSWAQKCTFSGIQQYELRARILVNYHFGDFVNALGCIAESAHPTRKGTAIQYLKTPMAKRRARQNELENLSANKIKLVDSLNLDAAKLLATLRKGDATVITFCDAPREHGDVIDVIFLGRRAWFPKGPALIAVTARVPIQQVISYRHQGVNRIEMPALIDCEPRVGESIEPVVRRITQALVDTLEVYLLQFPDQWLYLRRLPGYFASGPEMNTQ